MKWLEKLEKLNAALTWRLVILLSVCVGAITALAVRFAPYIKPERIDALVLLLIAFGSIARAAWHAGLAKTSDKDRVLMRDLYDRGKTGRPPPPEVRDIVDDAGADVVSRNAIPPKE